MPKLFGPTNPQFTQGRNVDDTGWVRVTGKPVTTKAETLGEAIKAYELAFSVKVTPYDGSYPTVPFSVEEEPKYFVIRAPNNDQATLVDIHILRNGATLCPKQKLDYRLEFDDVLDFGPLIC